MKDLHTHIKVTQVLDPVAVTATGNSGDIDLAGANSACLIVGLGDNTGTTAAAGHKLAFTLQHGDATDALAAVAQKDVIGATVGTAGLLLETDADAKYEQAYKWGYVGGKRYLKLTWTETGTVDVPMSLLLVQSHLQDAPVIA